MITRRTLISAAASLPFAGAFQHVGMASAAARQSFNDKVKDIAVGLDDPSVRVIWVSGPPQSGKSFVARYLLAALGASARPITLHVPTEDDRKRLCSSGGLAADRVSTGVMPLRRRTYKYVIIDPYEGHPLTPEGDVLALAKSRTLTFGDGKVIVFSEIEISGWKNTHHVRFAPIA